MRYVVGDAEVDFDRNRLARGGVEIDIEPRVADVLRYLAERPGQVVGRDELIEAVWKTTNISDGVLSRCAALIRRLFEDDAQEPRVLETITKRGYRLIADVRPLDEAAGRPAPIPRFEAGLFQARLRTVLPERATSETQAIAGTKAAMGAAARRVSVRPAGTDLVIELRRPEVWLAAPMFGAVLGFVLATTSVLGQGFRYSEGLAIALTVTLVGAGLGFVARRSIRSATLRRMRRDLDAILTAARLA